MNPRLTATFLMAGLVSAGLAFAHGKVDAAAKSADGHAHEDHDGDAIGVAGDVAKVSRTINVDMSDAMRFTPSHLAVRQGETVHFVIKNSGAVKHEFVLGTENELREHYELMKKFPEMEHSDPNMVTVAPGKAGEVVWQFTRAGKVDFACLQPGHYEAGMKGSVKVAAAKGGAKRDGRAVDKH